MLIAAVFGALPVIPVRLAGFEPEVIDAIGDEVGLATKLRNPEGVNHIRRRHPQPDRGIDRNDQFIGGDHPLVGAQPCIEGGARWAGLCPKAR